MILKFNLDWNAPRRKETSKTASHTFGFHAKQSGSNPLSFVKQSTLDQGNQLPPSHLYTITACWLKKSGGPKILSIFAYAELIELISCDANFLACDLPYKEPTNIVKNCLQ